MSRGPRGADGVEWTHDGVRFDLRWADGGLLTPGTWAVAAAAVCFSLIGASGPAIVVTWAAVALWVGRRALRRPAVLIVDGSTAQVCTSPLASRSRVVGHVDVALVVDVDEEDGATRLLGRGGVVLLAVPQLNAGQLETLVAVLFESRAQQRPAPSPESPPEALRDLVGKGRGASAQPGATIQKSRG